MKTFILIVSGLLIINFLRPASDNERLEAYQLRSAQDEKEMMARDLMLVRQDIIDKLNEIKNLEVPDQSREDLEQLKITLENENKIIRKSIQNLSTANSWMAVKGRALITLNDVKEEFSRVRRKMERSLVLGLTE